MDAIVIRLGFWTWEQAGSWFGVPLGNFYAWFIVVLGFSLLLGIGRLWSLAGSLALLGDVAVALLAIQVSVIGLSALLRPYYELIAQGVWAWLIISVLLGDSALLVIWLIQRTQPGQPLDLVLLSVPMFFQFARFGALLAISTLILGVGLYCTYGRRRYGFSKPERRRRHGLSSALRFLAFQSNPIGCASARVLLPRIGVIVWRGEVWPWGGFWWCGTPFDASRGVVTAHPQILEDVDGFGAELGAAGKLPRRVGGGQRSARIQRAIADANGDRRTREVPRAGPRPAIEHARLPDRLPRR